MNVIDQAFLRNAIFLYNYLGIYGVDKYNTKEDLLLLNFIKDILNFTQTDKRIKRDLIQYVESMYLYITHSNPQLGYCRQSSTLSAVSSFDNSFDPSF